MAGALLRAALVASCFLGALPPVDFRAVCFVRAITRDSIHEIQMVFLSRHAAFEGPAAVCDWSKITVYDWLVRVDAKYPVSSLIGSFSQLPILLDVAALNSVLENNKKYRLMNNRIF